MVREGERHIRRKLNTSHRTIYFTPKIVLIKYKQYVMTIRKLTHLLCLSCSVSYTRVNIEYNANESSKKIFLEMFFRGTDLFISLKDKMEQQIGGLFTSISQFSSKINSIILICFYKKKPMKLKIFRHFLFFF